MTALALASQVLAQRHVTRWRVEVQQKSGRWTLAGYLPAMSPDERPAHACYRMRQTCSVYAKRTLRARPA